DGKLVQIDLWRSRCLFGGDWFVDWIEVENKFTKEKFVFPIFRWIKAKFRYHINHLDTSLPQNEVHKAQRRMELAEKRKTYQFEQKVPGGPVQVKKLPPDEKFPFAHVWDIVNLKFKLQGKVLCKRLTASKEWTSLDDLNEIYNELDEKSTKSQLYRPEVSCKRTFLGGLTIAEAISRKRLFICDLEILDGLPVRQNFVLCSPIGLFFVDDENQLMPVAIQLFQKPGPDNPIFIPDKSKTWALVKMWYNNADAAYHQAVTHLGEEQIYYF
ncbi:unnamed protein product, partial [Lymnaea stagnalis]